EITEQLFLMKLSVNQPYRDSLQFQKDLANNYSSILSIIEDFEKTNLTEDEAIHLSQLKQKITSNFNFSNKKFENEHEKQDQIALFNHHFEEAFKDVKALSEIQLFEGEKLTTESGNIVSRSSLWTQLEMAVL